jgi:SAM-dependent methyltransferase
MTPRDCPVCDRREPQLVYRQRFAVADDGCRITGYEVVECRRCGAVYADGIPSQEALDRYYAQSSKYEYLERGGEAPASLDESHRGMAAGLRGLVPDVAARIVDVGCGNGDVLGLLREAGYTNLLGIDPAENSALAARRLYGVEVVTGSVLAMPSAAAAADLVVLSAVLEHVRDVPAALRQVAAVLSAQGLLYIEVPDLARFRSDEAMPFQQFSVEHINYFTAASLAHAAVAADLRLAQAWSALRRTGSTPEPVICAVFGRGRPAPDQTRRDRIGPSAARRYVARCEADERRVRRHLADLTASGAPFIVWGAGTHMQHLLAQAPLNGANIVAIVDANPRLHGIVVAGLTVTGPEALQGRTEPILAGSPAHESDIVDMARDSYGLRNEFLSLAPPPTVPGEETVRS